MLPPGHIAMGFLVGSAVAKYFIPSADVETIRHFGYLGAFWGFAPDLDEFWFFYKNKNLLVCPDVKVYHRSFISHAPFLWLLMGLGIYFFANTESVKLDACYIIHNYWWHFLSLQPMTLLLPLYALGMSINNFFLYGK